MAFNTTRPKQKHFVYAAVAVAAANWHTQGKFKIVPCSRFFFLCFPLSTSSSSSLPPPPPFKTSTRGPQATRKQTDGTHTHAMHWLLVIAGRSLHCILRHKFLADNLLHRKTALCCDRPGMHFTCLVFVCVCQSISACWRWYVCVCLCEMK